MLRNTALLVLCSVALARPEIGPIDDSGLERSSGMEHGSGSGAEYGSGSGVENGSGSGLENGSGSGLEYGSGMEHGSGSGMEYGSGSGAENSSVSEVDNGSGSGLEYVSTSTVEYGSALPVEYGSGAGLEIGSGSGSGAEIDGSGSGSGVEIGSGSGAEGTEASGNEPEIVMVTGDGVNVFHLGRDDADVVVYQEAANIYNRFGSGSYDVEEYEDDAFVPKTRGARSVNSTVESTGSDTNDTCEANSVCFNDSDCGEKGRCLGVFVGKCNCNSCINLITCEDDSACGGLRGACLNTTISGRMHCECLKAHKANGFSSFMDTLQHLCNVKDCGRDTDTCFGLPCNSGRCIC